MEKRRYIKFKEITFAPDFKRGGIRGIYLNDDPYHMNWLRPSKPLGFPKEKEFVFDGISEDGTEWRYKMFDYITLTGRVYEDERGVHIRLTYKNVTYHDYYCIEGSLGLWFPFNSDFPCANLCIKRRCNAHIWCGENVSYVNLLRMGLSDKNLGLFTLQGGFCKYSQKNVESGNRGDCILHPSPFIIKRGEEYNIDILIFEHNGRDFKDHLLKTDSFLDIRATNYVVFKGEKIRFEVVSNRPMLDCIVKENGKNVLCNIDGNVARVEILPERIGEYKFDIEVNGIKTKAIFLSKESYEDMLFSRAKFIVEKQQCLDQASPLNGAYLVYDNELKTQWFSEVFGDHTATRERLGMPIFLAHYYLKTKDEGIKSSLLKFIEFALREFVDEDSGMVYDRIGKKPSREIRLYNFPWVSLLFVKVFEVTGESRCLRISYNVLKKYYDLGGVKFYPNAVLIDTLIAAYDENGFDTQVLRSLFLQQCDFIRQREFDYPKHEVPYEQTIVAPAVNMLFGGWRLTGKEEYKRACLLQNSVLDRFNGMQPDHRLHGVAIRCWDDYFFGKHAIFGDTLPHYWSVLSAFAEYLVYQMTGNEGALIKARSMARACLSLFNEKGEGSCAHIYPLSVDGKKGEFDDAWANDQDFALYFAMLILEETNKIL